MKDITLKQIADTLGISITTVSKALKNYPDVSPKTKNAVLELAKNLQYTPNSFAVNLRTKESKTIGLIIPEVVHHFFSNVINGIIEEAEKRGILKPGDTIIETTSGNTGFSLAMVSIIKGYNCILAVSSKSSKDKIDMLRSLGAKVYVCPAHVSADDERSYYNVAKRLHEETKGSVYINQYFNQLNIDAHYLSTGPEIWKQTNGKITHLVACSGTGGTISGTAKYLKEHIFNI